MQVTSTAAFTTDLGLDSLDAVEVVYVLLYTVYCQADIVPLV